MSRFYLTLTALALLPFLAATRPALAGDRRAVHHHLRPSRRREHAHTEHVPGRRGGPRRQGRQLQRRKGEESKGSSHRVTSGRRSVRVSWRSNPNSSIWKTTSY